ncbi:hypothetical protein, partial [Sporomusa sp.]|uniref:hypothetical protein n=1 Tax=Sporomusa sp. TaxID=2078658 RepID=UPI002CCE86B9
AWTTLSFISCPYRDIPFFPDMTKPPVVILSYNWRLFLSMSIFRGSVHYLVLFKMLLPQNPGGRYYQ